MVKRSTIRGTRSANDPEFDAEQDIELEESKADAKIDEEKENNEPAVQTTSS